MIDGHSLLFRAYHALPKTFRTKEDQPTNAVYGFCTMLLKVVEDLKPDYLAVAFDEAAPTFRHAQLVTYKEGRPEMDDDLQVQQPVVRELLKSFAVPVYSVEGYEGEDIIATIVAKLRTQSLEFYIVSGDRDVLQLVDKNVKVYSPRRGLSPPMVYDEKNVAEVFGVGASQIPDFKGLRGDSSDKIPGVFGIGDKTAAGLIKRFGSLEKLYQNIGKVRGEFGSSVESKLLEGAEQAVLSKGVALITDEAPLKVELKALKFGRLRRAAGLEFLKSLGFKSILKRLGSPLIEFKKGSVDRPKRKVSLASGQGDFWSV